MVGEINLAQSPEDSGQGTLKKPKKYFQWKHGNYGQFEVVIVLPGNVTEERRGVFSRLKLSLCCGVCWCLRYF